MLFQTRKTFVYLRNANHDIFDEIRAFRPCIDSNTTEMFNVQKGTKHIVKIVHVTSVVQT